MRKLTVPSDAFLERERLTQEVQDPAWQSAYREIEQEEIELAEDGMAEYAEGLKQIDEAPNAVVLPSEF
jgi:hypothetical protein